jgi:RND family efflux transporter MFP subunit
MGSVLIMLASALAGCGASSPPGKSEAASPAKAASPLPVRLAVVRAAGGAAVLEVAGTVRLKRETPLAFNTPGRIAAILVREGEAVRAGQVLARLDATSLDAATASARAEVVRARADLARAEDLFTKGWVTAPRVEQARATLAAAEARARSAGFDRALAVLTAPAAGVVLSRPAEPGQIAQPGQTVLTIGELREGHVLRLPMADRDAARVTIGMAAQVTIPALSSATLAGRISEVGARSEDGAGTFRVEVRLPPTPGLASGQIGRARIALTAAGPAPGAAGSTALVVPTPALFAARADEGFVYVHDAASGRVRRRLVTLGPVDDDGVTVLSGLKAGERVAVTGIDRLRDGQVVVVGAGAAQ